MSKLSIRRLIHDQNGMAATELALMMPILLTLFFTGFEVARYILITQKVEKSVYAVADIVAQQTSVTDAQLDQIILAASEIMTPYNIGNNGRIILSSVYRNQNSNNASVQWQYTGGGYLDRNSKIGVTGNNATLPNNLVLNEKDNVIIAEFYFEMQPIFPVSGIMNSSLYKYAIFKPRLGLLTTPPT